MKDCADDCLSECMLISLQVAMYNVLLQRVVAKFSSLAIVYMVFKELSEIILLQCKTMAYI